MEPPGRANMRAMPWISSLELRNVKNFAAARCELRPLTVFIGPNNSGKTNVLRFLGCLSEFVRRGIGCFDPREWLRRESSSRSLGATIEVAQLAGRRWVRYSFDIRFGEGRTRL